MIDKMPFFESNTEFLQKAEDTCDALRNWQPPGEGYEHFKKYMPELADYIEEVVPILQTGRSLTTEEKEKLRGLVASVGSGQENGDPKIQKMVLRFDYWASRLNNEGFLHIDDPFFTCWVYRTRISLEMTLAGITDFLQGRW